MQIAKIKIGAFAAFCMLLTCHSQAQSTSGGKPDVKQVIHETPTQNGGLTELQGKNDFYLLSNATGLALSARILHTDTTSVYIRRQDGGTFKIPLSKLERASATLVAQWKKQFGGPLTDQQRRYLQLIGNRSRPGAMIYAAA